MSWNGDVLQTTLRDLVQEAELWEAQAAECIDYAADIRLFVKLYPEWVRQPNRTLRDVIAARHQPEAAS